MPLNFELGHMTCFAQWHMDGKNTYTSFEFKPDEGLCVPLTLCISVITMI